MTSEKAATLRAQIHAAVETLPRKHLLQLDCFIATLARPVLHQRLAMARRDLAANRLTPWRSIRRDVGA
jgi:hypothetical protein